MIPAIRNEEIVVFGDGEQRMDMIYVGDLVEILVLALILDHGAWDTIFEAGTGDAPTVNQITECVVANVERCSAENLYDQTRRRFWKSNPGISLLVPIIGPLTG